MAKKKYDIAIAAGSYTNGQGEEKTLTKTALLLVVAWNALLVSGCSQGTTTEVTATIVSVSDRDNSSMGCLGTNIRTVIETEDGYRDRICGLWGEEGDTIKGKWTVGHWDGVFNGFRPY